MQARASTPSSRRRPHASARAAAAGDAAARRRLTEARALCVCGLQGQLTNVPWDDFSKNWDHGKSFWLEIGQKQWEIPFSSWYLAETDQVPAPPPTHTHTHTHTQSAFPPPLRLGECGELTDAVPVEGGVAGR